MTAPLCCIFEAKSAFDISGDTKTLTEPALPGSTALTEPSETYSLRYISEVNAELPVAHPFSELSQYETPIALLFASLREASALRSEALRTRKESSALPDLPFSALTCKTKT